jgi:hypothetical protein
MTTLRPWSAAAAVSVLASASGLRAQTWQAVPTPVSPMARLVHGMVFDDVRGVTVLFGGGYVNGSLLFGDTWHFDGVSWSRRTPAQSPSRRAGPAMAFDRARGRTVLFGGGLNSALFADTWEYDGVSWTPVAAPTAPSRRTDAGLAYDLRRRCCVLFGGENGTFVPLGDTWQFDGNTWTQLTPATSPAPRYMPALVYDSAHGRTVLFGGQDLTTFSLGDTWTFDGTNWTQVPGPGPGPRSGFASAFDYLRGRTIVTGGQQLLRTSVGTSGAVFNDTWAFDGAAWTQIATGAAPSPRVGHAMAFDGARGTMVLFGGYSTVELGDTWQLVPAAVPTVARHGTGCAGGAGTPQLDALPASLPALGTTFGVQVTSLPNGPAFLLFATDLVQWNGAPLPLAPAPQRPDCLLWIGPAAGVSVALAPVGSTAVFALPIPAAPALAGFVLGMQALALDLSGPNASALSNGLIAQVR